MLKAGLILIVVQVFAVISGITSGDLISVLSGEFTPLSIIKLAGFLLPGASGLALIVFSCKNSG